MILDYLKNKADFQKEDRGPYEYELTDEKDGKMVKHMAGRH